MPTPRHASHAAFDPVETVTPPHFHPNDEDLSSGTPEFCDYPLDDSGTPLGAHRADWLVLHLLFYADFQFNAQLPVIALQDAVKDGI